MTLEDVHLSWWHWFHILIQLEGLLTILMNYMSLLSLLVDVIRMSVSTVFFLMQLDSGIISSRMFSCDYDLNGFKFRLNRHLLSLGAPSYQLFFMLLFFVFFYSSIFFNGCFATCGGNPNWHVLWRQICKVFLEREGVPLFRGPCLLLMDALEVALFKRFDMETPFLRVKLFEAYRNLFHNCLI